MGQAVSNENKFARYARCIYSGNSAIYDTSSESWSSMQQDILNEKFMREHCQCKDCTVKREDRRRLKSALLREENIKMIERLGL